MVFSAGSVEPIVPSGIWDSADDVEGSEDHLELMVLEHPWASTSADDVALTWSLIQEDLGFAYIPPEARALLGKLGGRRKTRSCSGTREEGTPIGDGSVSNAHARCSINEKVRLPGLRSIQQLLSRPEAGFLLTLPPLTSVSQ